ncbi:MAG: hypothetical protein Q7R41_08615, partial [Phycisphaerales bacterium]|nr:hypothetical protein [Phycisphaerales bacterium]
MVASISTESLPHGLVVPIPTLPPRNVAAGPAPACATASVGYAEEDEAKSPARAQMAVEVAETST